MTQQKNAEQKLKLELTSMKRNPYLADYHSSRNAQSAMHHIVRDRQRRNVKRRTQVRRQRISTMLAGMGLVLTILVFILIRLFDKPDVDGASVPQNQPMGALVDAFSQETVQGISATAYSKHPRWTEDFLTPNEYSRPGDALEEVNSIFVHYTGNKGTSAAQNRSYFEQLKDTQERSASAHFIIGYEGEIIQCIPLDEIAYAVKTRNMDSISIECCYLADDGSFTQETYDSLVALLQWLIAAYDLDEEDILRHYDCGGKKCPVYYTENEDAWELLKKDVGTL